MSGGARRSRWAQGSSWGRFDRFCLVSGCRNLPSRCTWWVHRLARGAWPPLVSMTRWLPCSAWKTPTCASTTRCPWQKRPASQVSEQFGQTCKAFMPDGGRGAAAPRYHLHVIAARGRHVLGRNTRWLRRWATWAHFQQHRAPQGTGRLAGAGGVLLAPGVGLRAHRCPHRFHSARTTFAPGRCASRLPTFMDALQASCSIPFVLQAVHH